MISRRREPQGGWHRALDYWDSPVQFVANFWPDVRLYNKQRDILQSLVENDETYVPAANMMGKDFVSGLAVLFFFLTRHPCRIVTTSVKDDHLSVLWGEIGRFVRTCRFQLDARRGGPLQITHRELRKVMNGEVDPLSYVKGMVAAEGAAMQGHHIAQRGDGVPRTLFVADEASGVPDKYHRMATTWANRMLVIGNTWTCSNFFYRAVMGNPATGDLGGDLPRADGGLHRKVIRITVDDSPNIRKAKQLIAKGKSPAGSIVVPGVKSWSEYQKNLKMWDPVQQTVSLWARFDESGATKLVPEDWLYLSEQLWEEIKDLGEQRHVGKRTIGHDSAAGGDNTCWCAINKVRMLLLQSEKTPDTNSIPGTTIGLMREWGVRPEDVLMDYGGGGKQHADRLRGMGFAVEVVGFGEMVVPELRRGVKPLSVRREDREQQRVFKNRRAQMYWMIRELLEPVSVDGKRKSRFAIPKEILNRRRPDGGPSLRDQLRKIPLLYDQEGRVYLPSKSRKPGSKQENSLMDILGCSPDEADAFALAVYGQSERTTVMTAGVAT